MANKKGLLCWIGLHYFHSPTSKGGYVRLARCFYCGKDNPRGGL